MRSASTPAPTPSARAPSSPYQKPAPCRRPKPAEPRETLRHATCERTNICTMFTRECARKAP